MPKAEKIDGLPDVQIEESTVDHRVEEVGQPQTKTTSDKVGSEVLDWDDPVTAKEYAKPDEDTKTVPVAKEKTEEEAPKQEADDPLADFDEDLLRVAARYGISREKVASDYRTPRELDLDLQLRFGRQEQKAEQPKQTKVEKYNLKSKGQYDSGLEAELEAMAEHYASQTNAFIDEVTKAFGLVGQHLKEQSEAQTMRESIAEEEWFDAKIKAKGEEWKDEFGEGPGYKLAKNSKGYKGRNKLFGTYKGLSNQHTRLSREEVFDMAFRAIHGDRETKAAAAKVLGSARDRADQALPPPTKRTSPQAAKSPEARGVEFVANWLKGAS